MNNQELIEYDKETQRLKDEVNLHLSKFQDLDVLFENAQWVIQKYFEQQDEYKDINTFTQYLKNEVKIYVNSFWKPRKEKKSIRERLIYVEETYSELIYFWEFNSVQARKEEFENRTEPEKELDTQRWYFWWLVWKIIWR